MSKVKSFGNYSINAMLKSAFQYELINSLETLPASEIDEDTLAVVYYLKKRIKELD
jgi:hypothetical protein